MAGAEACLLCFLLKRGRSGGHAGTRWQVLPTRPWMMRVSARRDRECVDPAGVDAMSSYELKM